MNALAWLDWGVLLLYAALVLYIGARVRAADQSAHEYALGGRRIPAWAALCSLLATELSAATFLGVPHAAYTGDWSYLQFLIGSIIGRVVVATWLLRLYFRLELTTVYGLLGARIGPASQRCAESLFILGRVLASGVRLFIAALAFATLTGFSVELSIVIAGVVAGIYTRAGGIRAVIWTDVLQGAVLLIAAAVVLLTITELIPGGLSAFLAPAASEGKLTILRWPAPLEPIRDVMSHGTAAETLWPRLASGWRHFVTHYLGHASALPSALIGGFFLTLAAQGTDQDLVQRLLTTRSEREGGRALVLSGVINVPIVGLFLLIGTGLWALYTPALGLVDPLVFPPPSDTQRVLPAFALAHLAPGLRGLVFAGLFAAAMSSLDSAVNALATSWMIDIRGQPETADARGLQRASVVFTGLLIGAAPLFVTYEQHTSDGPGALNLVELALAAMSVIYGGLLGSFLVILITPTRGRDLSVTAGMLIGALVGVLLFTQPLWRADASTLITWPWWIVLGALTSFAIGAAWRPRSPGGPVQPARANG
jgi:SSS family transporter